MERQDRGRLRRADRALVVPDEPGSARGDQPGEPFHLRDERAVAWLQNWYLVRETGVTLYGPDAAAVVPRIAWTEFVAATVRYADEVSQRSFDEASPGALAYAVLAMCRALRIVRAQAHGSKQEAATGTQEQIPGWAWLIDIALRCRSSRGASGLADPQTRAAAVRFIGLMADQIVGSDPAWAPSPRSRHGRRDA